MAGYILNASTNSPFKSKTKARCVPQPRHSIPNSFLLIQGNMYSSINEIIVYTILQKINKGANVFSLLYLVKFKIWSG